MAEIDTEAIQTLARYYQESCARIKAEEENKADLKGAILELLGDTKTLQAGDIKITKVVTAGRQYLDEKLLVMNGVDPEVIQASKKQGKPSTSIRVTGS